MRSKRTIVDELRRAVAAAEKRGVTRYRIAKTAGIRQSVLDRILDGTSGGTMKTGERIAAAIGMKLSLVPTHE